MGWLDLVAARYGCMVQGATAVAFTVLDALGYLDEIPVCVGYELDGKRIDTFPPTSQLKRCKPILEVLPGWKCDIGGIKKYEDLPENARKYVEFAEKGIGVPITMVSNGPRAGRHHLSIKSRGRPPRGAAAYFMPKLPMLEVGSTPWFPREGKERTLCAAL